MNQSERMRTLHKELHEAHADSACGLSFTEWAMKHRGLYAAMCLEYFECLEKGAML